ncbi:hypothetical protein [Actinomadura sp. BRA 177]|uniref:hypothetical protein n=1 Tax=Actinomadura sp. BRA 177 TaxID=2745202 RepID=UPI001594EEFD|nr:hypothetical protein [Actinomadura sp. BRA 177]NVI90724.1 hypothetical protein [Actinomadura sp. BRA 177]
MNEAVDPGYSVPFFDVIKKQARLRDAITEERIRGWLRQEVLADHVVIRNGDDHETERELEGPHGALGWIPRWKVAELLIDLSKSHHLDFEDVLMVLDDENLSLGEVHTDGEAFIGGDGQPWYCVYSPEVEEEN